MVMSDHYAVLGVSRGVDAPTLGRAYRRRAKEAHPDAGGSNEEMARINAAWRAIREWLDREPEPTLAVPAYEASAEMPWGKHAGRALTDIPLDYLVWVFTKAERTSWDLACDIRNELRSRDVTMPTVGTDGMALGDVVNDEDAWSAFSDQREWRYS